MMKSIELTLLDIYKYVSHSSCSFMLNVASYYCGHNNNNIIIVCAQ